MVASLKVRRLSLLVAEAVQKTLTEVMTDEQIKVTPDRLDTASDPSALNPDIFGPIEELTKKFWPDTPVVPTMLAGATDSRFLRNAGIPSYGHSGLADDIYDVRAHGRDERVSVGACFEGQEYLYQLVRALAGGK